MEQLEAELPHVRQRLRTAGRSDVHAIISVQYNRILVGGQSAGDLLALADPNGKGMVAIVPGTPSQFPEQVSSWPRDWMTQYQ